MWGGLNGTERKKGAEDEISFGSSAFVRYTISQNDRQFGDPVAVSIIQLMLRRIQE